MNKLAILLVLLPLALAKNTRWAEDCGISKYPDAGEEEMARIVGGWEARNNEFPWQAYIRFVGGSLFCGGVFINEEYVLTAAHCTVGDNPNNLEVVLGEHLRSEDDEITTFHRVERNTWHEDYGTGPGLYDHDIALLKLTAPVDINENIFPVCPPDENNNYAGDISQASGWGSTRSGGSVTDELRWVAMGILTNEDCNYGPLEGSITDNHICAGDIPNNDRDTCQGDSGGPLTTKIDGLFHVIGLTSWGYGCASGTPGVYARVSVELGWIDDNMY